MTWDCLCTQSTDAAKNYNKELLSKHAQLEEGCLAAIIPGTLAEHKLGNTVLLMFNPIRERAGSASTKWKLLVVGNDLSKHDTGWQQGLEELLFGSLESDQTTIGRHEISEIKGIPRVILEAEKSNYKFTDHSMILRILDLVNHIFANKLFELTIDEINEFDFGVVTKVMQRLMCHGLTAAASTDGNKSLE